MHLGEEHRPAEDVVQERGPITTELDRRVEHRERGRGDRQSAMHLAVLRRELATDHIGARAATQPPSRVDADPTTGGGSPAMPYHQAAARPERCAPGPAQSSAARTRTSARAATSARTSARTSAGSPAARYTPG